jgi:hypothetical protein
MAIGIPGAAPTYSFPATLSGYSGLLIDDDASDGWWAGTQQCFTAVAVALALAGNVQAAQIAQDVTTADAEIYAPVSRGPSGSSLSLVFIDSDRAVYLQPWVYDQPDTVPPRPFEVEGYQPPSPWPPTTAAPFVDEDLIVPVAAIPPEADYLPPLPWPVPPQPLLLYPTDEKITIPPLAGDDTYYQPHAPWGQEYILRPLGGGGSRIDPAPSSPLSVGEEEYQPPQPWGDRVTFMLWLMDEAPPFVFTEDEYQPPAPWVVRVNIPNPWYADDTRPTPVTIGVEPDPWPLPSAWDAPAFQLPTWLGDERATPVAPFAIEPDPWVPPFPWPVAIGVYDRWAQDELSSIAALGQDESGVQPVLVAWPYRVAPQPQLDTDQRPTPSPIAESMDELFPKVFVERRWVVPQPWEIEQHLLAFLSPHTPVIIRDKSGARYIVQDASLSRYGVEDESKTRYEVEP